MTRRRLSREPAGDDRRRIDRSGEGPGDRDADCNSPVLSTRPRAPLPGELRVFRNDRSSRPASTLARVAGDRAHSFASRGVGVARCRRRASAARPDREPQTRRSGSQQLSHCRREHWENASTVRVDRYRAMAISADPHHGRLPLACGGRRCQRTQPERPGVHRRLCAGVCSGLILPMKRTIDARCRTSWSGRPSTRRRLRPAGWSTPGRSRPRVCR